MGYTVFSMSVIPSFCQHLGFCSIALIAFVQFFFNLHHTLTIRQCMFNRKIGTEGSTGITRITPLCNSYNKMLYYY